MDRLTHYILDQYEDICDVVKKDRVLEIQLIRKLALYEDTNLTPQDVEELKKENEELKSAQNKLAVEKLEEVLEFIYSNKWTNIELCVDNSPLKIIRNELYTMIAELKGEKDE